MFDTDRFQEIWVTITRNKVRSVLTGFGVFWGIFMIIIMLGAGNGLERGILKQVDGFATNSCFMGSSRTGEAYKGFKKGRWWNIRNKDILILKESVEEIEHISPIIWGRGGTNNVVRNDNAGTFNVRGLYPNYAEIERQRLDYGRFINDIDIAYKRKVCLIGTKVYEELFPKRENPLGHYIRVNGIYYQVVGVASGVANVSIGGRLEQSVIIPFTTMQQINNRGDVVNMVAATAKKGAKVEEMEEKMKQTLKAHNSISPTDQQAIWGFNMERQFKMFELLFLGITVVILVVGAGTLIAGMIGISNIMMVTIKERTREIGVRRALGATPSNIMKQVLSESLLLTSIAGIFGLCFGVLILYLADAYLLQQNEDVFLSDPMVSLNTAIISLIALLGAGLLAGGLPAWRALQIKAIDAIREE